MQSIYHLLFILLSIQAAIREGHKYQLTSSLFHTKSCNTMRLDVQHCKNPGDVGEHRQQKPSSCQTRSSFWNTSRALKVPSDCFFFLVPRSLPSEQWFRATRRHLRSDSSKGTRDQPPWNCNFPGKTGRAVWCSDAETGWGHRSEPTNAGYARARKRHVVLDSSRHSCLKEEQLFPREKWSVEHISFLRRGCQLAIKGALLHSRKPKYMCTGYNKATENASINSGREGISKVRWIVNERSMFDSGPYDASLHCRESVL